MWNMADLTVNFFFHIISLFFQILNLFIISVPEGQSDHPPN